MLFECQYSHFPPIPDLFATLNLHVSVANQEMKTKLWLGLTLRSTYSWGSAKGTSNKKNPIFLQRA